MWRASWLIHHGTQVVLFLLRWEDTFDGWVSVIAYLTR
jgi:hypothetical protein